MLVLLYPFGRQGYTSLTGNSQTVHPIESVRLAGLMKRTRGRPEVRIGLVDGPVWTDHPGFAGASIRGLAGKSPAHCQRFDSVACAHGTFVAGLLAGEREGISPDCTLLVRPVFSEGTPGPDGMPNTTPLELGRAILSCIDAGACVINLSLGLARNHTGGLQPLDEALHHAVRRDVLVVAAAGNHGRIGSSPITGHRWVIPVVACDRAGRPLRESNLGGSMRRRGVVAPGSHVTSLSASGGTMTLGGTSVAAPFVTGTIALLWSEFPEATASEIRWAVTQAEVAGRGSIVPGLLDAEGAYLKMWNAREGRRPA